MNKINMSPDSCWAGEGVEETQLLILNKVCETSRGTKIREPSYVFYFYFAFSKLQLHHSHCFTLTERFRLLLLSLLSDRKQDNASQGCVLSSPSFFIVHADSSKSCQGSQEVKVPCLKLSAAVTRTSMTSKTTEEVEEEDLY